MAGKNRTQEVRIIGGKWKGRKLPFQGGGSLRPTPSRTRETLFNWLRPHIHGLSCLDLFAGSGVLGFEALSQGAGHCIFIDSNRRSTDAIHKNITTLAAHRAQVRSMNALRYLRTCKSQYDVVFLDPPFKSPKLLSQAMQHLIGRNIATNYLYVEARDHALLTDLTEQFPLTVAGQTKSGDSHARLFEVQLQA